MAGSIRLNSERAAKVALDDHEGCRGLREMGEQVARVNRQKVKELLADAAVQWVRRFPAAVGPLVRAALAVARPASHQG